MPIISIDSDTFIEALKKLGIPVLIATAIVAYFVSISATKYVTYEEWHATVEAYDAKVQMIKADCKNDTRCENDKVIFTGIKTKEDVINKLNTWITDDFEDANTYKIK